MKSVIAAFLVLFSSSVFGNEDSVMKCQMSILKIDNGNMSGEPRSVSDAILAAGTNQFYAVVGERVISSPVLVEHKGNMVAYHSGVTYSIRKDGYFVIYDDFGYVFDECVKV